MTIYLQTRCSRGRYVRSRLKLSDERAVIEGYIVDNSVSTHPIDNLIILRFDPASSVHVRLAVLSREAHAAAAGNGERPVRAVEAEVSAVASRTW